MQILMNNTEPAAWEVVWNFFRQGGWFMIPILACSFIAVAVVAYKMMTLARKMVVPADLEKKVQNIESQTLESGIYAMSRDFKAGQSTLARLCGVAARNSEKKDNELQKIVQSAAREEIVKMHTGMPVLEVVITIAPLLGLLGTASGLVLVFANVGQGADPGKVGQGIAMALNTTVAGLAVAVPTVIAHSYFNRKIEMMTARLEVLLGKMTSACQQEYQA